MNQSPTSEQVARMATVKSLIEALQLWLAEGKCQPDYAVVYGEPDESRMMCCFPLDLGRVMVMHQDAGFAHNAPPMVVLVAVQRDEAKEGV
jgi:hypothetical protein